MNRLMFFLEILMPSKGTWRNKEPEYQGTSINRLNTLSSDNRLRYLLLKKNVNSLKRSSLLKEQLREQEVEIEQNKEIKEKIALAKDLRRQASDIHDHVTQLAEDAQKHHDLMVECYRKADSSREKADESHKKFVEAQEAADNEHKLFIACQKELRDYDKVIGGLRKKNKKVKTTKEQKEVRKEAEQIFSQFKAGEKLTTEDLLLLQRSKLL